MPTITFAFHNAIVFIDTYTPREAFNLLPGSAKKSFNYTIIGDSKDNVQNDSYKVFYYDASVRYDGVSIGYDKVSVSFSESGESNDNIRGSFFDTGKRISE